MIFIVKHIEIEGPGTLEDFFRQTTYSIKTIELGKGEALPSLDECEAIISLGGPMNVYETDKYPFLKEEERFIKEALERGIPILGICLGAQLLARACGAEVRKAKQKEIGWHRVNLTEEAKDSPLFRHLPKEIEVFQWHEDTFEIPPGGKLLASSGYCSNQAFSYGNDAYGLQFHIEVTPEMIESWVKRYPDGLDKNLSSQEMIINAYKNKDYLQRYANLVYLNFARIIDKSRRVLLR